MNQRKWGPTQNMKNIINQILFPMSPSLIPFRCKKKKKKSIFWSKGPNTGNFGIPRVFQALNDCKSNTKVVRNSVPDLMANNHNFSKISNNHQIQSKAILIHKLNQITSKPTQRSNHTLNHWYLRASLYITVMSIRASCTCHYGILDIR